jgi:hypothetical protein
MIVNPVIANKLNYFFCGWGNTTGRKNIQNFFAEALDFL